MGILDIFKPLRKKSVQRWSELGAYNSTFTLFGSDMYNSDLVRSCVRPLAEFSSKATAICSDSRLEKVLNERPNMYMNGKDFLYKVRTRLELYNNCFIYLERDDRNRVIGLYPVPYTWFEAVEYKNGLFIKFHFGDATGTSLTLPWQDIAVIRKDYNKSDVAGDDNIALLKTLDLLRTTNEGLANSIKSTANLRGILKSTKAMLAPEAVKKQKDDFVADYLNLENNGGIASLDSTQEFTPITMNPLTASYEQMREIRADVYRFFGVNEKIVTSDMTTEELENFYKLRIEPFLIALSRELTSKIYPNSKQKINYMAEQGQFMTMSQKIELFNKVVLYNGLLVDEWRTYLGLGHIEGGDKPIMRLDAAHVDDDGRQMGREEDSQEEEKDDNN